MSKKGTALSEMARAVNSLLDKNQPELARKLAFAAVCKFPENKILADLLEKALSSVTDIKLIEKIYNRVFKYKDVCPANYYHLGMFYKRVRDFNKMKRVFVKFLRFRKRADIIHTYIAYCTLDKYDLAFETAENIIDAPMHDRVLSRLWNPWGDRASAMPKIFFIDRLNALKRAKIRKKFEHYRVFFRAALLFYNNRREEAIREFKKMPKLSPERYGWMHFPIGWTYLYSCKFQSALNEFKQSVKSEVSRIPSMGRIGEIYICTGSFAKGFDEFAKALKVAAFEETAGLITWKGQMHLFTGDYKTAVKLLGKGAELGDDVAFCWRGAAYARMGRLKQALNDLDKAIKLFPTDLEARVWRAEVLRLSGKYEQSLKDINIVIAADDKYVWAYFNRALIRSAMNDYKGMKEDFEKIDGNIIQFIENKLFAGKKPASMERMLKVLEEGCKVAMGNRRNDKYFYPIWMGEK